VALPFGLRRAYLRGVVPAALITLAVGVLLVAGSHLLGAHEARLHAGTQAADLDDDEDTEEPGVAPAPRRGGPAPVTRHRFVLLSELYAALAAVEWCLLALTRQHQDQLARRVALDTEVPPDDPEATPRVWVDVGWLKRKLRRRLRGLLIFAVGMVVLAPLQQFSAAPAAFWGIYWSAVFTLGRSRRAWSHGLQGDPWFLRVDVLLGRAGFLARWFLPRLYFRLLRRVTRDVAPACLALERAPAEGLGLGLARMVCSVPVVYLITRPLFAVAAAHALGPRLAGPGNPVPPTAPME
jgi:hypothetical protein